MVLPNSRELFPEHFYLITDQDEHAYSAEEILHLYRRRGKAEAHMGELNRLYPFFSGYTHLRMPSGYRSRPPM